tara:strand:+ start:486 stop:719 length:234 start_codon:yes stop_codon:yes gene_type:complete
MDLCDIMSWVSVLKWGFRGGRRTLNSFEEARSLAFSWSFAMPHVIREKDGKFTVMMKKDTSGAEDYGPIVWEQQARR